MDARMNDYPPMQDEYFAGTPPIFAMWRIKQTAESRFIIERRWWYWPVWKDVSSRLPANLLIPSDFNLPDDRLKTLEAARARLVELKGKRKMEPRYWYEGDV